MWVHIETMSGVFHTLITKPARTILFPNGPQCHFYPWLMVSYTCLHDFGLLNDGLMALFPNDCYEKRLLLLLPLPSILLCSCMYLIWIFMPRFSVCKSFSTEIACTITRIGTEWNGMAQDDWSLRMHAMNQWIFFKYACVQVPWRNLSMWLVR